jgi:hypothetical protein
MLADFEREAHLDMVLHDLKKENEPFNKIIK